MNGVRRRLGRQASVVAVGALVLVAVMSSSCLRQSIRSECWPGGSCSDLVLYRSGSTSRAVTYCGVPAIAEVRGNYERVSVTLAENAFMENEATALTCELEPWSSPEMVVFCLYYVEGQREFSGSVALCDGDLMVDTSLGLLYAGTIEGEGNVGLVWRGGDASVCRDASGEMSRRSNPGQAAASDATDSCPPTRIRRHPHRLLNWNRQRMKYKEAHGPKK